MRKLALLSGLFAAACLLGMGTCNLFRDPTSPPSDWLTIEPDSVKGDTTFYSLPIKAGAYQYRWGERTKFAVYHGYWYFYYRCWEADPASPYGESLAPLTEFRNDFYASVAVLSDSVEDASNCAKARQIIEEAGGTIRLYAAYGGYHGFVLGVKDVPYWAHLPGDVKPLEFLSRLYQHSGLFAEAAPQWPCTRL